MKQKKNEVLFRYGNPRLDDAHINDCYIRALVFALKMDYCEIERTLADRQQKIGAATPNHISVISSILRDYGYAYKEVWSKNTASGHIQIRTFLYSHKGEYVLHANTHLAYATNGMIIDTWDCTNKTILGYWEKENK